MRSHSQAHADARAFGSILVIEDVDASSHCARSPAWEASQKTGIPQGLPGRTAGGSRPSRVPFAVFV